tara:strand:+ start:2914 stop:3207 length:294 start_codon:yes stop_codon:yes gene_type:complete
MARDLIRLQAHSDLQTVCDLAIKWSEKSSNPEITEMRDATARIINWTIYLEQQHSTFDAIINKALDEKHKALEQLKELDKVKKELVIANAQLAKFYS